MLGSVLLSRGQMAWPAFWGVTCYPPVPSPHTRVSLLEAALVRKAGLRQDQLCLLL